METSKRSEEEWLHAGDIKTRHLRVETRNVMRAKEVKDLSELLIPDLLLEAKLSVFRLYLGPEQGIGLHQAGVRLLQAVGKLEGRWLAASTCRLLFLGLQPAVVG
jgi:hypothetical protein